jgi:iron complex outermembrane receptor protein
MGYDLSGERRLSLSGGMVNHNTEFSIGSGGAALVDGTDGFLRADYRHGDTRFRAFWNRGRSNWKEFEGTKDPTMDSDVYDLTLEHSLSLPFENRLVVGGGYRRNTMRSNIYAPERIDQDLWALFFEEEWRPAKAWSFVTSGRMDRHPFTGWVFSPRGSLVFSPTPEHVFRLSAGTSFRNPTLTENNLNLTVNYRSPLNIPIKVVILGDLDLKAERMVMVDVGHSGHFGPVKTTVAGFHYRIKDLASVRSDSPKVVLQPTLEIRVPTFYFNTQQETRAWGGELGIEATANRQVTVFANYSYQRLTGELDFQVSSNGGPKHKLNGGVRIRSGGLTFSLQAHWVGRTFWNNASLSDLVTQNIEVDSYFLLNPHIGYTFSGSLKGLEVGFDGFNILDRQHFEILPTRAETDLGQSGEIVRRRMTATLSYGF